MEREDQSQIWTSRQAEELYSEGGSRKKNGESDEEAGDVDQLMFMVERSDKVISGEEMMNEFIGEVLIVR